MARRLEPGDVETILAPFAPNVVFASPGIAMLTGDASQSTIHGRDRLRTCIEAALRRTRGVRYTLTATYVGTDRIVLGYSCGLPAGSQKQGADSMRLDDDGRVVEWRCQY